MYLYVRARTVNATGDILLKPIPPTAVYLNYIKRPNVYSNGDLSHRSSLLFMKLSTTSLKTQQAQPS